jgi:hypothetical protein
MADDNGTRDTTTGVTMTGESLVGAVAASRLRARTAVGLVAAGLAGGLVVATLGVAGAQTSEPTPTPSQSQSQSAPQDGGESKSGRARRAKIGGRGGHGLGPLGHGIHGEFTVRNPNGDGYRVVATQRGVVTAVSATSISVRSEDGFSRTYVIDAETRVRSGDQGLAGIVTGDTVGVAGVVSGTTATATRIVEKPAR